MRSQPVRSQPVVREMKEVKSDNFPETTDSQEIQELTLREKIHNLIINYIENNKIAELLKEHGITDKYNKNQHDILWLLAKAPQKRTWFKDKPIRKFSDEGLERVRLLYQEIRNTPENDLQETLFKLFICTKKPLGEKRLYRDFTTLIAQLLNIKLVEPNTVVYRQIGVYSLSSESLADMHNKPIINAAIDKYLNERQKEKERLEQTSTAAEHKSP